MNDQEAADDKAHERAAELMRQGVGDAEVSRRSGLSLLEIIGLRGALAGAVKKSIVFPVRPSR